MKFLDTSEVPNAIKWVRRKLKLNLYGVSRGFAAILDGLVAVLSLGFVYGNFERCVVYCMLERKSKAKRKKETENASN